MICLMISTGSRGMRCGGQEGTETRAAVVAMSCDGSASAVQETSALSEHRGTALAAVRLRGPQGQGCGDQESCRIERRKRNSPVASRARDECSRVIRRYPLCECARAAAVRRGEVLISGDVDSCGWLRRRRGGVVEASFRALSRDGVTPIRTRCSKEEAGRGRFGMVPLRFWPSRDCFKSAPL